MAVTMKKVREALDPEEPNYLKAKELGPEALPHLEALVASGDPMLASKATYLASLIDDARTPGIIRKAAQSSDAAVRVAAAAAAANLLAEDASGILGELATDRDPGVRKVVNARRRGPQEAPQGATIRVDETPKTIGMPLVFGRMPGEAGGAGNADVAAAGMRQNEPGGGMPGEGAASGPSGLMPGEKPGGNVGGKGEMPS